MSTLTMGVTRRVLAQGLYLAIGCLPLWYIATHKGEPLFVGYTPELWAPLMATLALIRMTPVSEGRRQWIWALLALALSQVLLVFLLEEVVNFGVVARRWMELALPGIAWYALMMSANPVARWLYRGVESAAAYEARAASLAGMTLAGGALLASLTLVLTVSSAARTLLLDDSVLLMLAGFGGLVFVVATSGWFRRGLRLQPLPGGQAGDLTPTAVESDLKDQLRSLGQLQNRTILGLNAGAVLLAASVHLWLGESADMAVVLGFFVSQIGSLLITWVLTRKFRRTRHSRIRSSATDLEAYRHAAEHTPLALPPEPAG